MSRAWDERRRELLSQLKSMGNSGRAENASTDQLTRGFYPVPEHLRLLDPDVVLVIGPRGSGKTQICKVLTSTSLSKAVERFAPNVRLPSAAEWLEVFPAQRHMFEVSGLKAFIAQNGSDPTKLREVWLAYLLRLLKDRLDADSQRELAPLFEPSAAYVDRVHNAFASLGAAPIAALDKLDETLERENRHLFVTYDELDTLGSGDWDLIQAGIQGLVSLWATYTRRWSHFRAKLFIRTDMYDRHARTGGADLYKLAASRVELSWSSRDLYSMLLKRIANESPDLATYLKEGRSSIQWDEDEVLGLVPRLKRWEDARPSIERLVGPYMGANQKKGLVYRWLLDHVRDGVSRVYPRPLVQMIELAAGSDASSPESLDRPRLLRPSSLRRALDRISSDYVRDLLTELPWLQSVIDKLKASALVPYAEKDIVRRLDDFQGEDKPPYSGKDLVDYLIELGVLRRRPDGRIDAPDLFLHGMGLRRKGGVSRKK
ncbi:hypothetical protein QZM97_28755 [Burkholderia orbicola]|uniref:P-loop ATPase, Sll1717 family n=1 Tax=Burkholderia orbicola TaxID=2978683 RepID=UPI00264C52E6|nr:hypothetical protein [Burkholderia orbicola]MDN7994077.1 hypothetical protein [Burkholderia orbicola]